MSLPLLQFPSISVQYGKKKKSEISVGTALDKRHCLIKTEISPFTHNNVWMRKVLEKLHFFLEFPDMSLSTYFGEKISKPNRV